MTATNPSVAVLACATAEYRAAMPLLAALATLAPDGGRTTLAEARNPYRFQLYDPEAPAVVCRALGATEEVPVDLVDAMRRALESRRGLGIAAPHVGGDIRLAIVPIDGARTLLVNPRIVGHSRSANRGQEGSLATPGFFASIVRWDRVTVRYEDEFRAAHQVTLTDALEARVLQHQMDALDGSILPPGLSRQQKRHAARAAAAAR